MTRTRRIGIGLALQGALLWSAAVAQEADAGGPIRTGEHAGFTRVVMVIDPRTEWALETNGREVSVHFPGRTIAFSTERAWDRITRARVHAIEPAATPDGTVVRLGLGCDCRVTTTLVGGRYLALDVHDAPPGQGPEAALAASGADPGGGVGPDPGAAEAALREAERMLVDQLERAAAEGLIELASPPSGAMAPPPPAAGPAPAPSGPAAPATASGDAEPSTVDVGAAPERPAPARAMTEPPAPNPGGPRPRPALPGRAEDAPEAERLAAHLAIVPPAHEQIAASTVFDRDRSAMQERAPLPAAADGCLPDSALDVARWSDGRPLPDQAVELRRLLVGEFDRPNPSAVRDLARLHIRHGLGAEAGEILRGFDAEIEERALLADLARVVEGREPLADGPLASDLACPGRHGLWLALAGRPAAIAADPHFRSLRTAFEEMPADLRRLIGPALVGRFLDADRVAEARILHDVVARTASPADADLRLVAGRLAAAERRAEEAEALLAGLVAENTPNLADAVIALVRTRLDAGGAVPEAWITDLQALALEHRGSPRALRARALLAEALARNGALRDAFAVLAALHAEEAAARPLVGGLAPRLLAAADPAVVGAAAYAETALEHARLIPGTEASDPERVAIGGRLIDLGLANAAVVILEPAADRGDRAARLLAARAHLALGEAPAALARLAGLDGAEAAELRARALAQAGDFAAAAEALADAGEREAALPYAWAGGVWELAAEAGDPVQATMAAYMQNRGTPAESGAETPASAEAAFRLAPPRPEEPSLQAARGLLAAGREIGGFVEALLAGPD